MITALEAKSLAQMHKLSQDNFISDLSSKIEKAARSGLKELIISSNSVTSRDYLISNFLAFMSENGYAVTNTGTELKIYW